MNEWKLYFQFVENQYMKKEKSGSHIFLMHVGKIILKILIFTRKLGS